VLAEQGEQVCRIQLSQRFDEWRRCVLKVHDRSQRNHLRRRLWENPAASNGQISVFTIWQRIKPLQMHEHQPMNLPPEVRLLHTELL
jgi:hypothetical protein